jgi:hypothetical protein
MSNPRRKATPSLSTKAALIESILLLLAELAVKGENFALACAVAISGTPEEVAEANRLLVRNLQIKPVKAASALWLGMLVGDHEFAPELLAEGKKVRMTKAELQRSLDQLVEDRTTLLVGDERVARAVGGVEARVVAQRERADERAYAVRVARVEPRVGEQRTHPGEGAVRGDLVGEPTHAQVVDELRQHGQVVPTAMRIVGAEELES